MSAAERFIETATAPLADANAELHLAAADALRQRIDAGQADALDRAAARLATRRRARWIAVLLILMGVVSLPVLIRSALDYRAYRAMARVIGSSVDDGPPLTDRGLTPQDKLLLFGDPAQASPAARWKALWDSRPGYPPYFAEYAVHHISEHKTLPPDFLETAARIDPDNGWYWLLAAGMEADKNATRNRLSTADREGGEAWSWTIADPSRHQAALELIHTAAAKPRLTSYSLDLLKQRIALLPERSDYVSQFPPLAYLAGQSSASLGIMSVGQTLAAEAERCGKEADPASYQRLKDDLRGLAPKLVGDSGSLVDALVARAILGQGLRNLRDAASTLGLPQDGEAFSRIDRAVNPGSEEKRLRDERGDGSERMITRRASLIASLMLPTLDRQLREPLALEESELAPTRRAEHSLLGRSACLAGWLVLGLALLASVLFRFRGGPLARELGRRLPELLTRGDWAWVLAGGILAPALWHLAIAQLSPLAAHHWSMRFTAFAAPAGQFTATGWLMIVAPIVLARWRLGKRAGFLGFRLRHGWVGWAAVAAAALPVPLLGLAPASDARILIFLQLAGLALGFSQLWAIVVGLRALLGKPGRALQRQAVARALVPAYGLGMMVAILAVPAFHASERHWIRQDRLMEISADEPAMSRHEYRITQRFKAELLDSLGGLP